MPTQVLMRSFPFAVLLAAAAYLFLRTLAFDFPRVPGRLGPDVWPQAILVLLMVTCAVGIVRAFTARRPAPPRHEASGQGVAFPGELETEEAGGPPRYGLVAGGLLLFLGYPLALEYLGFLVATFLLMTLFMVIGQWRNISGVLVVSAVGTLVLFYIFRGVVYVSLPLGSGVFQDWTVWVASTLGMR